MTETRRRLGANPYVTAGPVREAPLFVGREAELEALRGELVRPVEGVEAGTALVVLWGPRQIGKTSILAQLEQGIWGDAVVPVFVDLGSCPRPRGSAGFWRLLAQRVVERLREAGRPVAPVESLLPGERERSPNELFRRLLQAAAGAAKPARLLLLVDHYEQLERWVHAGHVGVDVIDGLGGILDANLPVSLLFAGGWRMDQRDPEMWGRLGLRAVHRAVSFLPPEAVERLVREPLEGAVEPDAEVVPAVQRATACHPFLVQAVCRALFDRLRDAGSTRATLEALELALEDVDDEELALPFLLAWWRGLGFLGRVVASVLAAELEDDAQFVPLERAEAVLAEGRATLEVDRAALRGALEALVEAGDLERTEMGYRFRADVVRRWVSVAHPVLDVARCVADEPDMMSRRGVRQRLRQHPLLWVWLVAGLAAVVLIGVRLLYPTEDERPPGVGTPVGTEPQYARGWRLGPELAPVPLPAEDAATVRAEAGRLATFQAAEDGAVLDVTVSWPTGVPAPAHGWLDALAHPEESWLWGVIPALAPDGRWLEGADERYARDPLPGTAPAWLDGLLAPAARLRVEYENGYPARILAVDRTGWTRAEWCVASGGWERCEADGQSVQRIEFSFAEHGREHEPLLAEVRFADRHGRAAADALGRTRLSFLYRDVDPDPNREQWEVEVVTTVFQRVRTTGAGTAPFAPPAGWQGLGTTGVALSGDRTFLFYFREEKGVGRRGGELAAIQSRDHVGRAAPLGLAWGSEVQTLFFFRGRGVDGAFFVGIDGNPAADAAGAAGYREERTLDGVRTRLVALGPDGKCVVGERREEGVQVVWCETALAGVPDPALAPAASELARLAAPTTQVWRASGGAAAGNALGVPKLAVRDLGAAPPPCERLLAVQHHDAADGLAAPPRGPFTGSAASRLAVRWAEGRLADVVRTDCTDGPCAQRDVLDETWSCNAKGCVLSSVPLDCRPPGTVGR
ncbi:MAG: ATP-binding protein [Deltaproteobacteria bacterium]|nr:ATP-binding protein [Deltaproteobacteria bacterium]